MLYEELYMLCVMGVVNLGLDEIVVIRICW